MKQEPHEIIDGYYTRLCQLAQRCNFDNPDAEIKSQTLQSCLSSKLRQGALRDRTLTLPKLLDIARMADVTEHEVFKIEQLHMSRRKDDTESVNKI